MFLYCHFTQNLKFSVCICLLLLKDFPKKLGFKRFFHKSLKFSKNHVILFALHLEKKYCNLIITIKECYYFNYKIVFLGGPIVQSLIFRERN